jgi:histidine triad (HIT) family protein
MENCIFCKIARDEIPAQKATHEGDAVVSFPDINPKALGHTLVIPTQHYQWFQDMPDEEADKLFRAARKIARELKEKYGADFIKLRIDGMDIPHVHIHLLPQKLLAQKPAAE